MFFSWKYVYRITFCTSDPFLRDKVLHKTNLVCQTVLRLNSMARQVSNLWACLSKVETSPFSAVGQERMMTPFSENNVTMCFCCEAILHMASEGIFFSWQALEFQPEDKSCLVARSKCYLQLGELSAALQDAEASLKEDKKYHKVGVCVCVWQCGIPRDSNMHLLSKSDTHPSSTFALTYNILLYCYHKCVRNLRDLPWVDITFSLVNTLPT